MPTHSSQPSRLPAFRTLVLGLLFGLLLLAPGQGAALAESNTDPHGPTAQSPMPAAAATTPAASPSPKAGAEVGSEASGSAAESPPAGRTIVYGIPGLTINDIDAERTPNMYRLLTEGAAANLNVRTIGASTCPGSGWLSFGSGARAEAGPSPAAEDLDEDDTARCPSLIAPTTNVDQDAQSSAETDSAASASEASRSEGAGDGAQHAPKSDEDLGTASVPGATTAKIEGFESVKAPNIGSGYTVDYGMLARLVNAHETASAPSSTGDEGSELRTCAAAEGPGAAYAVADENGIVANYTDNASATDCRLGIVDLGAIGSRSWLFNPIPNYSYTVPVEFDREARVAEADRRLGAQLEDMKDNAPDGAPEPTVIVAGLGDSSGLPQLRAFLVSGPGFEPGSLSSATTRSPGLLQLTDLAPGILDILDIPSPSGVSFELTPTDDSPQQRIDDLVADAQKATSIYQHLSTFSLTLDITFYVLFLLCGIVLSRAFFGRRGGATVAPMAHRILGWACLVIATVPTGAYLAGLLPWSRMPLPGLGLSLSVAGTAVAVFLLSLLPPWGRTWRGRVAALTLANLLIISIDLATGSRLQANSLLGYNPIVGGRYYGLGNQGAAIYIVSLFIFLGIAISWLRARGHRRAVIIVPSVLGLAAVFVSGNPSWGAKFGGTIAILAGLMVLLALVARIRLSLLRLILIGATSLTVLLGIAFLDWLREPGSRSHFGNFFDQLVTGEALQVIGRKLGANLHIIQINPALAIVTPLAVIAILLFLRYLLVFPAITPRSRTGRLVNKWRGKLPQVFTDDDLHFGFLAAATGLGLGLILTDSGIAVPSTGAMVLLPYLLALSAEHAEDTVAKRNPASDRVRP